MLWPYLSGGTFVHLDFRRLSTFYYFVTGAAECRHSQDGVESPTLFVVTWPSSRGTTRFDFRRMGYVIPQIICSLFWISCSFSENKFKNIKLSICIWTIERNPGLWYFAPRFRHILYHFHFSGYLFCFYFINNYKMRIKLTHLYIIESTPNYCQYFATIYNQIFIIFNRLF